MIPSHVLLARCPECRPHRPIPRVYHNRQPSPPPAAVHAPRHSPTGPYFPGRGDSSSVMFSGLSHAMAMNLVWLPRATSSSLAFVNLIDVYASVLPTVRPAGPCQWLWLRPGIWGGVAGKLVEVVLWTGRGEAYTCRMSPRRGWCRLLCRRRRGTSLCSNMVVRTLTSLYVSALACPKTARTAQVCRHARREEPPRCDRQ